MGDHVAKTAGVMPSKVYDVLKFVTQVVLPGAGAAYFGLAQIWNWPAAEQVVGSIAVIVTFLGLALSYSSSKYKNSDEKFDGDLKVFEPKDEDGKPQYLFEVSTPLDQLPAQGEITLRVVDGDLASNS